jgi:3'-phosphoadenosine 5'-phosphosulfate sulfotransferase
MGAKPRIKKVLLFAKPKRAPAWWPRAEDGAAREVVVTDEGGGWSIVPSRKDRVRIADVDEIVDCFEMLQDRRFRFRVQ